MSYWCLRSLGQFFLQDFIIYFLITGNFKVTKRKWQQKNTSTNKITLVVLMMMWDITLLSLLLRKKRFFSFLCLMPTIFQVLVENIFYWWLFSQLSSCWISWKVSYDVIRVAFMAKTFSIKTNKYRTYLNSSQK